MKENTLNPARKLFFGLFVFPLLIAVGMAFLLCSVVLLTNEKETPESLIGDIKSGSPSKRWQKAFELSNELNQTRYRGVQNPAVLKEIIFILKDTVHYDPKTRSYMAMALSHFDRADAAPALIRALKEKEAPQDVLIAAMWSLGSLGWRESSADIEKFLLSDLPELRKMSVYILGVLTDKNSAEKIRPLLNDPVSDVRWNAALTLARLGDDSGFEVLRNMVTRPQFSTLGMQEAQIEAVMINAIKGLALIQKPESIKILRSLSQDDKNLKVRQAAIDAMNYREKS